MFLQLSVSHSVHRGDLHAWFLPGGMPGPMSLLGSMAGPMSLLESMPGPMSLLGLGLSGVGMPRRWALTPNIGPGRG